MAARYRIGYLVSSGVKPFHAEALATANGLPPEINPNPKIIRLTISFLINQGKQRCTIVGSVHAMANQGGVVRLD